MLYWSQNLTANTWEVTIRIEFKGWHHLEQQKLLNIQVRWRIWNHFGSELIEISKEAGLYPILRNAAMHGWSKERNSYWITWVVTPWLSKEAGLSWNGCNPMRSKERNSYSVVPSSISKEVCSHGIIRNGCNAWRSKEGSSYWITWGVTPWYVRRLASTESRITGTAAMHVDLRKLVPIESLGRVTPSISKEVCSHSNHWGNLQFMNNQGGWVVPGVVRNHLDSSFSMAGLRQKYAPKQMTKKKLISQR